MTSKLLLSDTLGLKELQNAESLKIEGGSNYIKGERYIKINDILYVSKNGGKWRICKLAPSNNY